MISTLLGIKSTFQAGKGGDGGEENAKRNIPAESDSFYHDFSPNDFN